MPPSLQQVSKACAFYQRSFLASLAQHEQIDTKAKLIKSRNKQLGLKKRIADIEAKKKAKAQRRKAESTKAGG
jgi:BMFP domain-containing protein YqiC